jgi:DNA repair protein RadC
MNDLTNNTAAIELPAAPRRRKTRVNAYRTALEEPGACRLTTDELDTVTKALEILERKVMRKGRVGVVLASPAAVKEWLTLHYGLLDREVFGLIFLDQRNQYLGHQQLFTGDIAGASVHPRQVARSVFEYNAAGVICLHGHPSLVCEPSHADEMITRRLKEMLSLLDVRLVDHFIIGGQQVMSFAERGIL